MVAPAGTPKAIVDHLHSVVQQALDAREVHEKLNGRGREVRHGDPAQFAALIGKDLRQWAKVVAESSASGE